LLEVNKKLAAEVGESPMECASTDDPDSLVEQIKSLKGENDRFVPHMIPGRVHNCNVCFQGTCVLSELHECVFCRSLRDLQSQTSQRTNIIPHAPSGFNSNTRMQWSRRPQKKSRKETGGFWSATGLIDFLSTPLMKSTIMLMYFTRVFLL